KPSRPSPPARRTFRPEWWRDAYDGSGPRRLKTTLAMPKPPGSPPIVDLWLPSQEVLRVPPPWSPYFLVYSDYFARGHCATTLTAFVGVVPVPSFLIIKSTNLFYHMRDI